MKNAARFAILLTLLPAVATTTASAASVLTQDYDNARSGANLGEVILNPSNVSASTFGKRFAYAVDEEVFAQPLYVPNLSINAATHNVVFIATMANTVYAFDADNPATAELPLWKVNLGAPAPSSKFIWFAGSGFSQNGILSTPVIDPGSNTIYVVSQLWNTATQSLSFHLHALSTLNGSETFGGPVQISAPAFNADVNIQRAGLLLLNGVVYVGIASHADLRMNVATGQAETYVGLVLAYDAQTLALLGSFNADAGGLGGAVWQGGRGLVSDGTYVYTTTANAFKKGTPDYSESFVKLNPKTLSVADYFVDPDQACLNTLDLDLSSSGPQLLSSAGINLLLGGGKQGKVSVLSLTQTLKTQSPPYFWATSNHAILPAEGGTCANPRTGSNGWLNGSDTAIWNNPGGLTYFYAFGNQDELMSWQVSGSTFAPTSADTPLSNGGPSALALSANGGTGAILWTVAKQSGGKAATVSAYDAVPTGGHLSKLWDSTQVANRDTLGSLGRYSVPTVAGGNVYVATGSNQVVVYGLLPTSPTIQVSAATPTLPIIALNSATETVYVNAIGGYTGTVSLTLTGLPSGVTYSFTPSTVTLSTTQSTLTSTLTISPAGAVMPLLDDYTAVVNASASNGVTSYAPIRLLTRNGIFQSVTKAGCNASNDMSATLKWQIDGSSVPSIWIQDPLSPTFPGRRWLDPAPALGSATTGYWITNGTQRFFYWIIDQSAGIPANFDNALRYTNLAGIYKCP